MPRGILFLLVVLFPILASAQPMTEHHMMASGMHMPEAAMPTRPGQSAFAAIQEVVQILEADPATDWSKVNIDALRLHLIDMDNVTLHAEVANQPIENGMTFMVSGAGEIRESIQRMITVHATAMNGIEGWQFVAVTTETGASLTVTVPSPDIEKLRGLGFIGVLTRGMHHQMHHLMIARGGDPHH